MERRALAGGGLDPDASAVALDDLLADGEADAGAGVLLTGVQALKQHEYFLEVLGLDADPVVPDEEVTFLAVRLGADLDLDGRRAAILDGVAHQVLKQLRELLHVTL